MTSQRMTLNERQRAYLRVMPDWSAPYEIIERLALQPRDMGVTPDEFVRALRRLVKRGFADHSRANNTYRITDLGREALRNG